MKETRNMLDTLLELNLAENRKPIHMICVTNLKGTTISQLWAQQQ